MKEIILGKNLKVIGPELKCSVGKFTISYKGKVEESATAQEIKLWLGMEEFMSFELGALAMTLKYLIQKRKHDVIFDLENDEDVFHPELIIKELWIEICDKNVVKTAAIITDFIGEEVFQAFIKAGVPTSIITTVLSQFLIKEADISFLDRTEIANFFQGISDLRD